MAFKVGSTVISQTYEGSGAGGVIAAGQLNLPKINYKDSTTATIDQDNLHPGDSTDIREVGYGWDLLTSGGMSTTGSSSVYTFDKPFAQASKDSRNPYKALYISMQGIRYNSSGILSMSPRLNIHSEGGLFGSSLPLSSSTDGNPPQYWTRSQIEANYGSATSRSYSLQEWEIKLTEAVDMRTDTSAHQNFEIYIYEPDTTSRNTQIRWQGTAYSGGTIYSRRGHAAMVRPDWEPYNNNFTLEWVSGGVTVNHQIIAGLVA